MYLAFTTHKQHPNISTQHSWMTRSTFKLEMMEVKKDLCHMSTTSCTTATHWEFKNFCFKN